MSRLSVGCVILGRFPLLSCWFSSLSFLIKKHPTRTAQVALSHSSGHESWVLVQAKLHPMITARCSIYGLLNLDYSMDFWLQFSILAPRISGSCLLKSRPLNSSLDMRISRRKKGVISPTHLDFHPRTAEKRFSWNFNCLQILMRN